MNSVYELDLKIIETSLVKEEDRALLKRSYDFWKQSWIKEFSKLKVDHSRLETSDDFLHKNCIVLHKNDHPVGVIFNHSVDLSCSIQRSQSYFLNYPESTFSHLEKLKVKKAFVASYMTVAEGWRRKETDISISELLFSINVLEFMKSDCSHYIGYIRADKQTYEIFKRHGGRVYDRQIKYNVPVEYQYMDKTMACLSSIQGVREYIHFIKQKGRSVGGMYARKDSEISRPKNGPSM